MVFRCFYCTFWIPLLHSHTMWYILFYISFCTSYSYTLVKLYKTISIKYNLKKNITLFSSIAHGFFNVLTARMVNDLNESQNKKPKSTLLKSKSLDNFFDTSPNLSNHSTDVTSLHLSVLNVLTKFNFLNLTCFQNDTTILTKKHLHFLSLLFNILHFLIILIKTFTRMTI